MQPRDLHPRQEITYHCERNCPHSPLPVPFAAGVELPATWECRCGGTACREGATPPDRVTPRHVAETEPKAQLHKRRSEEDGAALLAERLEWAAATGVAR